MNAKNQFYEEATAFYRGLPSTIRLVTTQAVVSETYTFFRRIHAHMALRWLDYIDTARESGHLRLLYNDENDGRQAEAILRKFDDQSISYVDALSLVTAKRYNARAIFGFDHHLALTGLPLLGLGIKKMS